MTPAEYNFAVNSGFRFRCDASGNNDQIFIDQVTITGIGTTARGDNDKLIALGTMDSPEGFEDDFKLYPNPVKGNILNVELPEGENFSYSITNMIGQVIMRGRLPDK